ALRWQPDVVLGREPRPRGTLTERRLLRLLRGVPFTAADRGDGRGRERVHRRGDEAADRSLRRSVQTVLDEGDGVVTGAHRERARRVRRRHALSGGRGARNERDGRRAVSRLRCAVLAAIAGRAL